MDWIRICPLDAILPGGGACALIGARQVALFRPYADERVFALDNVDPFAHVSVLSRGLIVEHQGELWVASPLKKQRFRLSDGQCLEDPDYSVLSLPVEVREGMVYLPVQKD
ncbi:MAG: nitrite reductase small subunit NirD [Paludibacterium sp.]|uniref:nitrite reductase small subunit NirD n=1 Tax=Paludibacterium sp. TaxID=1917523 RepID=UPI0025E78F65|nr:nitrite reductase small subunit NirD [Paludibacterium sp.]MBV8046144.1 nitrite reductase small subunit NirD [Paludibacterium sp.]MBV8648790.1 nitrite reductase small subunit NirD [Paludibacterium sp.]